MNNKKTIVKIILGIIVYHFIMFGLALGSVLNFHFSLIKAGFMSNNYIVLLLVGFLLFFALGIPCVFLFVGCFANKDKMLQKVMKWMFPLVTLLCCIFIFSFSLYSYNSFSKLNYDSIVILEWSIFGASVAILVFWMQMLDNSIDKAITDDDSNTFSTFYSFRIIKLERIKDSLEPTIPALAFLSVNLISLILSTFLYYFQSEIIKEDFLNFATLFSFLFSTNSLIQVFQGIISSFKTKKKELINRITFLKNMEEETNEIKNKNEENASSEKDNQENDK